MDLIEFLKTMRNKYIILSVSLFIFLVSSGTFAQQRTYSPYSRYGIGDIQEAGFGRNFGMGNTGIALSSRFNLNDMNPASYTGMDSISFYFEGGMMGFSQKMKTPQSTNQFSDINFAYFAMGFPVAKWGFFSLGLKPSSYVGYEFFSDNSGSVEVTDANYYLNTLKGNGSIARAYAGLAVRPVKNLSLGMHFAYHFGNLRNTSLIQLPNDALALSAGTAEKIRMNDINFDFGAQYRLELDNNKAVTFGATFVPEQKAQGEIEIQSGQGTSIDKETNTVEITESSDYIKSDIVAELPASYGLGVAYELNDKLVASVDYSTSLYSKAKIPGINNGVTVKDRNKYAFGMEYIPNDRSADFYPSRIRYRLGTYYVQDYIVKDGNQLEDFGISFGVGLPLKRSKTSLNLGVQWGQRGTSDNNLTKEDYLKFTMNLTLHEFWFVKRQFD